MSKRTLSLIAFDGFVTHYDNIVVPEPPDPYFTVAVRKRGSVMTEEEFQRIAREDEGVISPDVCSSKYRLIYSSMNRVFYGQMT